MARPEISSGCSSAARASARAPMLPVCRSSSMCLISPPAISSTTSCLPVDRFPPRVVFHELFICILSPLYWFSFRLQLVEIVNQGKLISDEIIINLLSKRLEDAQAKGETRFILDGFPRTVRQAVTKCKHEYHLHCILEWSQRRVECPVCLQHLVLNDPVSQELLASVEREKNLRSRRTFTPVDQGNESLTRVNESESDDEQPIMWRFSTVSSRARNITRRQMNPAVSLSEILPSSPISNTPNVTQVNISPLQRPINSSGSLLDDSGKSDLAAFSESLKSKISTASIRYKESITKSTHSLKGKLIAHNDTVKELSREVQREMSAGIAGIARLISQKRAGFSVTGETSKETSSDSEPLYANRNT